MKKGGQLFITPSVALQVILADIIEEGGSHASALPFGHNHQPGSPVSVGGKKRADGQMRNQLPVHRCDKILGGWRVREI